MKKTLTGCLFLLLTLSSFAIRVEWGKNTVINQPVHEDLYVAGGTITINAPIYGDLVVAGGTITINDSVMYDIIIVGGNILFNGFVGDDIRCAGGQLHVLKSIDGDLVISGGEITIDKTVIIGGGLLIAGGDITINGIIRNSIKAGVGNLVFNGTAEKDIDMRGGTLEMNGIVRGTSILAAREISIGNDAAFYNNVRYWNKKGSLDFKSSIKNGTATYDSSLAIQNARWYFLGWATVWALLLYLGMALVMMGVIQYLFSKSLAASAKNVSGQALRSLGYGFLFLVAVPVAAAIITATVIGAPVGLLALLGYVVILLLATSISSLVASNWLNRRYQRNWNYLQLVFIALGVFILLKLLILIPYLGWLILLLLVCIAFGAILLNIKWKKTIPATT